MLEINDGYWKLDGKDMPIVTQSAHIGIQKSETNSTQSTVNENIKKATRALLKSTAMSTIVWISKGLFAINATSSAQVGAQQFIIANNPFDIQTMVDIAVDFSKRE
jgi:hypothetical protein